MLSSLPKKPIRRIIESNKKFFKLESYSRISCVEIDSVYDENITVRLHAWLDYSEYDDFNFTIPIKALMGEKEFADYVEEQEELELKIKAEKEKNLKEYKEYLRLKKKFTEDSSEMMWKLYLDNNEDKDNE